MTTVGPPPPPPPPPPSAAAVFGDRLDLAERFVEILATAGLERGLLGPREAGRLWDRHLLNCAVIGELIAPGSRVVDVGSGAGLPGLVLSIVRPDLTVDLVEPLLRRSAFLDEVVAELGLHARVARGRAESASIRHQVGGADVVVSRALAPLARLAAWCLPLARPGGSVMAIKGASVHEEIERDRTAVQRSGGRDMEVLEVGAGVVSPPTMVARFRRAH